MARYAVIKQRSERGLFNKVAARSAVAKVCNPKQLEQTKLGVKIKPRTAGCSFVWLGSMHCIELAGQSMTNQEQKLLF
jgi:hypothetical protein